MASIIANNNGINNNNGVMSIVMALVINGSNGYNENMA
jgi:hypothetical protein